MVLCHSLGSWNSMRFPQYDYILWFIQRMKRISQIVTLHYNNCFEIKGIYAFTFLLSSLCFFFISFFGFQRFISFCWNENNEISAFTLCLYDKRKYWGKGKEIPYVFFVKSSEEKKRKWLKNLNSIFYNPYSIYLEYLFRIF